MSAERSSLRTTCRTRFHVVSLRGVLTPLAHSCIVLEKLLQLPNIHRVPFATAAVAVASTDTAVTPASSGTTAGSASTSGEEAGQGRPTAPSQHDPKVYTRPSAHSTPTIDSAVPTAQHHDDNTEGALTHDRDGVRCCCRNQRHDIRRGDGQRDANGREDEGHVR
jgi:hypothetical protein